MIVSLSFTDIFTCFFLPFAHHIMANRHKKNDFGLYIQNLEVFSDKKKKYAWMFFFGNIERKVCDSTQTNEISQSKFMLIISIVCSTISIYSDFQWITKKITRLLFEYMYVYTISINIDWIMGNNCPFFCKYFSVLFQLPFQTNRNLWLLNFVLQRKFNEFFEVSKIHKKKKELPAFKLENRQIFPYK